MSSRTLVQTVSAIDNKLRTLNLPYGDAIAEGIIPGHLPIQKFGYNGSVGTTEELIWPLSNGNTYLSAAETLQVSSDDADDTAAGTGARTVKIYGQTTGFVEITETVTMDGATPVETTSSFLRVYRVEVITAGTSLTNEGLISVKDNGNTNTLATAIAGRGQTQQAAWTVPAGNTLFIRQIFAGESANKRVTVRLYTRDNTVTGAAWQLKAELDVNLSDVTRNFTVPLKVTEKTDVELRGEAGVTGGVVIAGWIGYYED